METIKMWLMIILVIFAQSMIVKRGVTLRDKRVLEGGSQEDQAFDMEEPEIVPMGASSMLIGYIYNSVIHPKEGQEANFDTRYSEMYFELINRNDRYKELELLTYYAMTYKKDITNKCKLSIKMYLGASEIGSEAEIKEFFKLCKKFGEFVYENLHLSPSFYKINYAFTYYAQSLEKELMWKRVGVSKMKMHNVDDELIDQESKKELKKRERLKLLAAILEQAIASSGKSMKEIKLKYSVDFSLINQFYTQYFEKIFRDVLASGKIVRSVKKVHPNNYKDLDLEYGIDEEVVEAENQRIDDEEIVAVVDNFDDCNKNSLYRFYQVGWLEPLLNIKETFPVMVD